MSNLTSPFASINTTFSLDNKEFNIQITKLYADLARFINIREIGNYQYVEQQNGQVFTNLSNPNSPKPGYRTVVNFGALPNATTKSVAHGIKGIDPGPGASTFTFTSIYATGTRQTHGSFRAVPIPYVNVGTPADGIEIWVDATNVNIKTTTANWTAFNAQVIMDYIKF